MYLCPTDKYLQLDNFDLIGILHDIEQHTFLLRFAFSALGNDTGWTCYENSEEGLDQGMILIRMYIDKIENIIEEATKG